MDRDGNKLEPGDYVLVPCQVKALRVFTHDCDVLLETEQPIHGTKNQKTVFALDALQVVKAPPKGKS